MVSILSSAFRALNLGFKHHAAYQPLVSLACSASQVGTPQVVPGKKLMWSEKNKEVYPPQLPGEERREAWVCHFRDNIKYSPRKMNYVAFMIRGMAIDEALKQLDFVQKKGARIVKEVLLEAQEMAVREHNVEYKSNLWIGESFSSKGVVYRGLRRHARGRMGIVHYRHCHYFVRLVEGPPPPPPFRHKSFTNKPGYELLKDYLDNWRNRRISESL